MENLQVEKLKTLDKYRNLLGRLLNIMWYGDLVSMNKFMKENSVSRNFSTAIQKLGICTYNNANRTWYSKIAPWDVDSKLALNVLNSMYEQRGTKFLNTLA